MQCRRAFSPKLAVDADLPGHCADLDDRRLRSAICRFWVFQAVARFRRLLGSVQLSAQRGGH